MAAQGFGGFGDEAGRVGFVVGDEHELIGAAQRGARGGRLQSGAAVEHERADELAQAREQRAVGGLVERFAAVGIGGGWCDHQPVGAAAQLRVQLGWGELTVLERAGEEVVDEHGVIGHQAPAERPPVGVGVHRDDAVAAQKRQQRPEQRGGRALADPALRGDDGDRHTAAQVQRDDQLLEQPLVVAQRPRLAHPRQRRHPRGQREQGRIGDTRRSRALRRERPAGCE